MAVPPAANVVIAAFAFVLGTVVGSFLNVCVWRMPRDESIVHPPSHCPRCNTRLTIVDLVPLVSFLALGRRCRHCGAPISWRYFVVEAVTGLAFLAVWVSHGRHLDTLAFFAFATILVGVFFVEIEPDPDDPGELAMIIPNEFVVAGLVVGIVRDGVGLALGKPFGTEIPLTGVSLPVPESVAGVVLGAGVFILIDLFSRLLFRKEGMGLGDVKLGAAIGAVLGPWAALASFGGAVALGALIGIGLMVARMRKRDQYIPFGPMMAVSAFVVSLWPAHIVVDRVITWWLAWAGGAGG
jgi:leader peptidase (prepilin peptidase)/N-methyltransferase